MTRFKNPQNPHTQREKQPDEAEPEYSQVLGFLLLRSFGADLAAAGGSGAQLGGEEEGETLHHPASTREGGRGGLTRLALAANGNLRAPQPAERPDQPFSRYQQSIIPRCVSEFCWVLDCGGSKK